MARLHKAPKPKDHSAQPGFDTVFEDLFGLNVRGLKTIWRLIVRPDVVFKAARHPKWLETYTPSIRLVFFLVTLSVVTRFVWASEGGYVFEQMAERLALRTGGPLPQEDVRSIVERTLIAFPFISMASTIFFALMLNIWGKGTSLVLRLRYYFLAVTPGIVIGNFYILLYGLTPSEGGLTIFYIALSIAALPIGFAADMSTTYRSGVAGVTRFGKLWRATLLAIVNLVNVVFANALSQGYEVLLLR